MPALAGSDSPRIEYNQICSLKEILTLQIGIGNKNTQIELALYQSIYKVSKIKSCLNTRILTLQNDLF